MSRAQQELGDILTQVTMEKAAKDLMDEHKKNQANASEIIYDVSNKIQEVDEDNLEAAGDDDAIERLRQRRIEQLKKERIEKEQRKAKGHGRFDTIEEGDFLNAVTNSPMCVVHFFVDTFERCKIMDMHLRKLAPACEKTRFVRMDANKAPFFTGKLQVKTLPTVVCFIDGIAVKHIIGFADFRNDAFSTVDLYSLLKANKVIKDKYEAEDSAASDDD